MIYYLLALIVFVIDRISKMMVVNNLSIGEDQPVLGSFFVITSARNRGAAFSILQNQRWFFIVITLIVAGAIIWYLNRMRHSGRRMLPVALSLVLGGAMGNFVDRAWKGEVVDFLQLHFKFTFFGQHVDYIYPIFNIADSCIVVGVALIFLDAVISWAKDKRSVTHEQV